jgi:hypothetical protein
MLRAPLLHFGALALTLSVTAFATSAQAQQPGQGPPMPIAVDFGKVPVGSWSEYEVSFGGTPPMTSRMALVAKGTAGNTIETSVQGGMMAMVGGKMVMSMTLPPGAEKAGRVSKLVMQMGTADPMEMPLENGQDQQFTKPDPKRLVGTEKIEVRGGSFKTKHYREKTAAGDTYDFWVNDGVMPLGLVKLSGEQKENPSMKGGFKFELLARGKDAKPQITKPAKPFDQGALMKQITGGRAGGAPPGGAAPAGPGAAPAAGPGAVPAAGPGAAPAKK